jgi:conjugal transfer pilus assembly protein TraK
MKLQNKFWAALMFAAVETSIHAQEFEPINVGPTLSPQIKISRKDFSRIAVFEGRITSIKFKRGDLDVNPDPNTGSAFILPNVEGNISAFIITQSGQAHHVNLVPTEMTARTIVLREPQIEPARKAKSPAGNEPRAISARVDRATSFDAALRRLIGAMARNEKPSDLTHEEVNEELKIWDGSRLWLMSRYLGDSMTGEHYRIQNTSEIPLQLDEREFYKPGVLAVSIEIHKLAAKEATDVFIVREVTDVK